MSRRRSYPPDRPTIIWRTTSLAHLTAGSCTALVEFQGIIASCHEQAQEQAHGASSTTDRCAGPPPPVRRPPTRHGRRRRRAGAPRPRRARAAELVVGCWVSARKLRTGARSGTHGGGSRVGPTVGPSINPHGLVYKRPARRSPYKLRITHKTPNPYADRKPLPNCV